MFMGMSIRYGRGGNGTGITFRQTPFSTVEGDGKGVDAM